MRYCNRQRTFIVRWRIGMIVRIEVQAEKIMGFRGQEEGGFQTSSDIECIGVRQQDDISARDVANVVST